MRECGLGEASATVLS